MKKWLKLLKEWLSYTLKITITAGVIWIIFQVAIFTALKYVFVYDISGYSQVTIRWLSSHFVTGAMMGFLYCIGMMLLQVAFSLMRKK